MHCGLLHLLRLPRLRFVASITDSIAMAKKVAKILSDVLVRQKRKHSRTKSPDIQQFKSLQLGIETVASLTAVFWSLVRSL